MGWVLSGFKVKACRRLFFSNFVATLAFFESGENLMKIPNINKKFGIFSIFSPVPIFVMIINFLFTFMIWCKLSENSNLQYRI